jgi:O-antigen/teichoic acid export membrane protein
VSTAVAFFSAIGLMIAAVAVAFAPRIAEVVFPSVSSSLMQHEVAPSLVVALVIFALSFPLFVANRVLLSYQEMAKANLWALAAALANLLGILIVVFTRGNLPFLVVGASGPALAVNAMAAIWLFGWHKSWLRPAISAIDVGQMRELFSTGWKFFITSTGWLINSQTDNLVIAHYLGPSAVTPYSVTFRLFAYGTLIQSFASSSLWPAYTEAIARRDYDWVSRMYRKQLRWNILLGLVIVSLLATFGRDIIRLWAGPSAVPTQGMVSWMALWNVILAALWAPSTILNATGRLRWMTVYNTMTCASNLSLSIVFVQHFGISGVIAATVVSFAAMAIGPTFWDARRALAELIRPA